MALLPPPPTVSSTIDGVTTTSLNPVFLHWTMQDQIIHGAINSTLTEKMLTHVTPYTTSRSAWTTFQPLNDFEMVAFLLAGIGPNYDPFVILIATRVKPLFMEEIYDHLLYHELRLEHHQSTINLSVTGAHYAAREGNSSRHSRSGHNSILNAPPSG
ncbi:hypothetical protein POTOM_001431 [Populus tomentosa]|uniref:Uncharacterized protein n=1 Tax=Populus tomentosa TaxID=118781 RepID=A0A8X8IW22_POPTO|nr:hypothetical protein POTOM_001431 [Populus tomentosa]